MPHFEDDNLNLPEDDYVPMGGVPGSDDDDDKKDDDLGGEKTESLEEMADEELDDKFEENGE